MAIQTNVTFDISGASANNGKIVIICADTPPTASAVWEMRVRVVSPSGSVIKAKPIAADQTFNSGLSGTVLVPIPKDTAGNYLKGTYQVTAYFDDTFNPTPEGFRTINYDFCPKNNPTNLVAPTFVLSTDLSCITGLLTAKDETPYTELEYTIVSRLLKITPPPIDTQALVSTSGATANITIKFEGVSYVASLVVVYKSNIITGVDLNAETVGSITIMKEVVPSCQTGGICEILPCVNDYFDNLDAKACDLGGWVKLPPVERAQVEYLLANLQLAKSNFDCGKVATADKYIAIIKKYIDCDCGCKSTDPVPFVPIS